MKTRYKLLLMALLGISTFSGCDDFLKCEPESSYSVVGAYKTAADFEQASVGMYGRLQGLYAGNTSFLYALNMRTDELNVITPGAPNGYLGGLERFTNDALNGSTESWLNNFFGVISRANQILDKIDGGIFTDEAQRDYIKGESYFFRAYSYWYLGHLFGGMPLYDKSYSVEETKLMPRSTQEETFDFAEKDFKSAISLLPERWSGNNIGRPSKYVAEAMLARMCMFRHQYAKAKPYLEDIINSKVYEMAAQYVDCVNESGEYGKERMFEIQFMGGQLGEGQHFTPGCLPAEYRGELQTCNGYNSYPLVSTTLLAAYEPGDLRKDISVATNLMINGAVDDQNTYIIKFHHTAIKPVNQNDWGINMPIIRYTDVKLMYAEALNELDGVNDTSIAILREVRNRAGLATTTTFNTKEDFLKAIIKERQVEFAFEGLRWSDLLRWGIAKKVMNDFLGDVKQDGGIYVMKDHQNIFPIPSSLLNTYANDKVMWQNPIY